MTYRVATNSDLPAIKALCDKYDILTPTEGLLLLAIDDKGEIKAIAGIKTVLHVEPLIGENSLSAFKLYDRLEKVMVNDKVPSAMVICDPQNENLFAKMGYRVTDREKIIMEKEF
jgi:N-acetylglutamate synthase-like GNAT family acetyltransferase